MKNVLLTCVLAVLAFACDQYTNIDIAGNWEVVELTEAGDSLAVDLTTIGFHFSEDGQYEFQSTLDYREAGTYRLDGPYLFSTDTLKPPLREKAVEITYLSLDTLHLRMKELGKERLMVLQRKS
ncbi:MAG: hypothetical protein AAFZ63_02420 [Bacteroidota bacterium]